MRVSVIVPTHNEEAVILKTIAEVERVVSSYYDYEIIIVDDCSQDDTVHQIFKYEWKLMSLGKVKLVQKVYPSGKGAAIKTGFKMSNAFSDYIIVMDADLQISPKEIPTFFKLMELYDADVVIGNKRHDYSIVRYSLGRRLVSFGYHLLVKLLFGFSLRDTQCGLKIFKRGKLSLVMRNVCVKRFAFDLEVLVALRDNNVRVVDAPVAVREAVGGGSVSLRTIQETFWDTIAVWWRHRQGWYADPLHSE